MDNGCYFATVLWNRLHTRLVLVHFMIYKLTDGAGHMSMLSQKILISDDWSCRGTVNYTSQFINILVLSDHDMR